MHRNYYCTYTIAKYAKQKSHMLKKYHSNLFKYHSLVMHNALVIKEMLYMPIDFTAELFIIHLKSSLIY